MDPQTSAEIASRQAQRGRWFAWIGFAWLLPMGGRCSPAQRMLVAAGLALQVATALATLAHGLTGVGGGAWERAIDDSVAGVYFSISAVIVGLRAVTERRDRVLWVAAAASVGLYAVAMDLWGFWLAHTTNPPYPSVCDFIWWVSYALAAAAIIGAGGRQARRGASLKIWLDGLIASTATAAVAVAFVLAPVVNSAQGAHQAVLAELLYPLADLVIGTLLVGLIGLAGWRLGRRRIMLAAAFVLLLSADSGNSIQVAHGATGGNSWIQLLYMAAFTAVALAAWQPEPSPQRSAARSEQVRWSTLVLPSCFAATAPVIMVYDHFSRVPLVALLLTLVAMMVAMLRLALALRDVMVLRDVQRTALTDELTGLPNRRMFLAQLHDQVEAMRRDGGVLTTLMLDLDNFKQLNDTLGHEAGDALLRLTGPRLTGAVRGEDLVARLGGDEFAILLPGCTRERAATVAQSVLDSFNDPLEVHGLTLRLTGSVGIASFPDDAITGETLLRCADVAMYEAKRSRRGWAHYSPERDANTRERLELSGELARALEQGEIEAVFQPIADTATGRIVAAESLVRWRKADGRLHPPSEFLEAVELSGLSRPLTRRVLELTLAELRDWRAAGHNVDASVNATVADLVDMSFPDEIAALLAAHGLPADALAIEVTESSIVADPERIGLVLRHLRELGVKVALDDFGTGYSSLTHLRKLPIDLVKIDRSFVFHMCDQPADAAIVYATIELAHRLGLRVVAEGVEDDSSWAAIRELGGERIQGYGLSRPLEAAQMRALLDSYFADSQSLPAPASTTSGGSIS